MIRFVIPRGCHHNGIVLVDAIVAGAFVNDIVCVGQRDSRKPRVQYRQNDAEYRKGRGLGLSLAVFFVCGTSIFPFVVVANLEFSKQDRAHQCQVCKHEQGPNEGSNPQRRRSMYRSTATRIIEARGALPPQNHGSEYREKGRQDSRPRGRKGQGSRRDCDFWVFSIFVLASSFLIVVIVVLIVQIARAQCVNKCRQEGNRRKYRHDGPQRG